MCHGPRRPQTGRRLLTTACLLLSACVGTIDSPRSWDEAGGDLNANANGARNPDGSLIASPSLNTTPGIVGGPGTSGSGSNGGSATGSGGGACNVGGAPMRRLTHTEYDNAVRELLSDTTAPATSFALDNQIGLFDNSAEAQTVPSLLGEQYMDAALSLADNVKDFPALMGCNPQATGATGEACVNNFITSFGRRAYRRALTADEQARISTLYSKTRAASDVQTGMRGVIAAILMSPNFLFKPEFGAQPSTFANTKRVTQYEQATRLASLVWASIPDDQLLQAAESDQLSTPAQLEAQARRMLADPRAKPAIAAFYEQWLGLSLLGSATKDPAFFPDWSDSLRDNMFEERRRFVSNVLWEDDGRLETLLTANYSFLNAPLAKLYGVQAPAGTDFSKVPLDASQRAGVMTQAAMLATFARPDESSPVKRGKWVRERMLCQDLPPPPALVPQLPAPVAGVSNRERFAMHTADPACAGCHRLIDGLGFGLERYDSVGAYRMMSQGAAVDASGMVNETADIDGSYSGGPELANLLAMSAQVRDCVPTQALRYAWGRRETNEDACSVQAVQKAFAASDGDLRELVVALTQNDAFTNYRQAD
jgi:hypothetical protein